MMLDPIAQSCIIEPKAHQKGGPNRTAYNLIASARRCPRVSGGVALHLNSRRRPAL